jgi:hypothetical protein
MNAYEVADKLCESAYPAVEQLMREQILLMAKKQSLRSVWPELFSRWSKEKLRDATLQEMNRAVVNELNFGKGECTPRGIY